MGDEIVVSIEVRGLGYAQAGPLTQGQIVVQGSNSRVRRVQGAGTLASPVSGETSVEFDLVSLPEGYHPRQNGTICIRDAAAGIDLQAEVELSRATRVEGVAYPDDVERPCFERRLVAVEPLAGGSGARGTHRGTDAAGQPYTLIWSVQDGGQLPDFATLKNLRRVLPPGMGSDKNVIAWAMEVFQDQLYVATSNWAFESLRDWEMWAFSRGPIDSSEGTEIWRFDGRDWERVVFAGLGDSYNHGIRNLLSVGNHIYAVTVNHSHGFEIWRSDDGRDWRPVMTGGFGNPENTSGRGIVEFEGQLYLGTENKETGAEVWRAPVEEAGSEKGWKRVLGDDVSRSWYAELTEFDGWIYAGTLMTHTGLAESQAEADHAGCRVLRSRDGEEWEIVVEDSFGDPMNNGIISMAVFEGRIYIGTSNTQGGEIHSSADGLQWERCFKGEGDPQRNWHAWKLYVFRGRLYAGIGRLAEIWWSGLGMFSSADGKEWVRETDYSLLTHYGMRSMMEYRGKLFLGTASFPDGAYVIEADGA